MVQAAGRLCRSTAATALNIGRQLQQSAVKHHEPITQAAAFNARLPHVNTMQHLSTPQLVKALAVHRLCSSATIARNAENLYSAGTRTIGTRATHALFRRTFFEKFVAGETNEDLRRESARLLEKNILLMLCPPMEDIHGKIAQATPEVIQASTDKFIAYLDVAAELNRSQPQQQAVVQFKPTAVFPNQLMELYSQQNESKGVSLLEATNQCADFAQASDAEFSHDVVGLTKFCMTEWMRLGRRAAEHNIPIIVDGELRSTHFMLHALTLAAAKLYNTFNSRPLIFGTFQCYMKDTPAYLAECQRVADAEAFTLGAKCVRGAYLDAERAIAAAKGLPDPTHPTHAATNAAYDDVIRTCLQQLAHSQKTISLYVATMNRQSVENALTEMDRLQLRVDNPHIQFGQIYGMCDHLTYTLGELGAAAYKSVPWGRVEEWVAYFGRRAVENHTALQTARNETPYYYAELRRRAKLG